MQLRDRHRLLANQLLNLLPFMRQVLSRACAVGRESCVIEARDSKLLCGLELTRRWRPAASAPGDVIARLDWLAETPRDATWIDEGHSIGRYKMCDDGRRFNVYLAHGHHGTWSALRLAHVIAAWRMGGLLLHATALNRPGQGVLVGLAESGGGKSTLTTLARGFESLSDETVLVDLAGAPHVHGTPFRSASKKVPRRRTGALKALMILEKSPVPSLTRVGPGEALRAILGQMYRPPPSIATSAEILKRARSLAESVSAYRFAFPKDERANALLRELVHAAA